MNLSAVIFSAIIVIVSWSLIEGWFPFTRRKWLFLAIGMIYAIFLRNSFYRSKRFMWLVAYVIILLINMISGDKYFHDVGTVGFEFFCLGFPSIVATIVLGNNNRKDEGVLFHSFLLVLVVTTVASTFIDAFILPNAIRMMTRFSITMNDMSTVYSFYRMGLSTYAFPHALPVLIPPIVMGIKNKNLSRKTHVVCWVTLVSLGILIYLSGIMTALLLSIIGLLMAFVTINGNLRKNITRFAIIGILTIPFFSPTIMGSILHDFKTTVGEESYYYDKLESFESNVSSNGVNNAEDGDWAERIDLYSQSTSSLLNNIFIGTNERVGGHSSFLDRLGLLGIVGIIPFILFIILQMRFSERYLPINSKVYYYEGFLMGILMLLLKSSFQIETLIVLFAILPIATSYLSFSNSQTDGRK